jgi:1-aminocyclopropane-1-carboxylate deaminase
MLERFERYPLTFGPTHIEKLARLSEHRGGEVEIYAKREDCNSELPFGSNKLRKLEYIIPDAIASNVDTLVSVGGVQSNHTRMVAAVAAKIGMKCRPVQENRVPHGDAVYDRIGNILFLSFFDRESVAGSAGDGTRIATVMTGRPRDGKSLQSPLRGATL